MAVTEPATATDPAATRAWYTAFTAFRAFTRFRNGTGGAPEELAESAIATLDHVEVRGTYELTGFRAEADLLLWLVSPDAESLQRAIGAFARSDLGAGLEIWWSSIGIHRQAEFSHEHIPAFAAGTGPLPWVCVYPYVRTHDWYLLPPQERRRLLAEHGRMGREYPDVQANTVSAFGLGDYEWLLAFEAEDLSRITDLMRHLRAAEARRFTRHELPFLTGRRTPLAEIVGSW